MDNCRRSFRDMLRFFFILNEAKHSHMRLHLELLLDMLSVIGFFHYIAILKVYKLRLRCPACASCTGASGALVAATSYLE